MGPRGVALAAFTSTKRCPLLWLHRQKGLQERKGSDAHPKHSHLYPRAQSPELHNPTDDCKNLAQCLPKEGGHAYKFGWLSTRTSWWAPGSNSWGSPPIAKFVTQELKNLPSIACRVPHGATCLGSLQENLWRLESARGYRPLLAIHPTRGACHRTKGRPSRAPLHIMLAASLTLGNLLTFFVASSSTFTSLRGAEGTSVTNTLSKKSSFRHGWPPLKLVWPLGKPLDLTAPPRTPTSNLESS